MLFSSGSAAAVFVYNACSAASHHILRLQSRTTLFCHQIKKIDFPKLRNFSKLLLTCKLHYGRWWNGEKWIKLGFTCCSWVTLCHLAGPTGIQPDKLHLWIKNCSPCNAPSKLFVAVAVCPLHWSDRDINWSHGPLPISYPPIFQFAINTQ